MHFAAFTSSFVVALLAASASAQRALTGTARGYAAATTGGGEVTPIVPVDIAHLAALLADDQPRVIHISKTYDFTDSMGKRTSKGCIPSSNTCGVHGQNAIDPYFNWCSASFPKIQVTYEVAGVTPLLVGPNKTLRGIGANAVIRGRGLWIRNSNIIVQNIHITNLNPSLIWGGDAIYIQGTSDLLWFDHLKISLIGRMMLTTDHGPTRRMTISNSEFDGVTTTSASCNNEHYWTLLMEGTDDRVTFHGNHIHDTSGRGPKLGGLANVNVKFHAVNNLWETVHGHAFDTYKGSVAFVEGNYLQDVQIPVKTTQGRLYVPDTAVATAACRKTALRRVCVGNHAFTKGLARDTGVPALFADEAFGTVMNAREAQVHVRANAGVGKI
ncbi:hypothetical protein HKX48_008402 [Thoreauomyces humboldtii]|nr:hypothetical protein HKX48_008402 [Thoreauomyces humboldtii]